MGPPGVVRATFTAKNHSAEAHRREEARHETDAMADLIERLEAADKTFTKMIHAEPNNGRLMGKRQRRAPRT